MHKPKPTNYYNDNDEFCCRWLEKLIAAGELPPGDVDRRSITDVRPHELTGYRQCHFFAGIGGWPLALRLAKWPADRPVWTGSCPCQPFSIANTTKNLGTEDARHLWPFLATLITYCNPPVVFGEQVEKKAGREWLAGVQTDLAHMGYVAAATSLCAASVGAPHVRQRLYWVAHTAQNRQQTTKAIREGKNPQSRGPHDGRRHGNRTNWDICEFASKGSQDATTWRRIKPEITPLAHGIPNRMATLCGLGNAIVPQVAAEFIAAYMEVANIQ
jgi:DNA (cytosine-5)-methyltransferase 1